MIQVTGYRGENPSYSPRQVGAGPFVKGRKPDFQPLPILLISPGKTKFVAYLGLWYNAAMADIKVEKIKALELATDSIVKRYGKGAIMRLGESAVMQGVEIIPSGSLALDLALGVGGIPRGRVTEIFGPEASGKTTLAQHIIAEAQRLGGTAAYIDVEHAIDADYAKRCGVNTAEMLISQPDTGEEALDITEQLVRSNAVDVVVIDSVAALAPRVEIEGEIGDAHVGLQARLMSQALRKLCASIGKSKTAVVFLNQLREKIGVLYGNPEVTPGGRALKFYASVRIDLTRIETLKQGNVSVGSRIRAKVVKNKVAPPFRNAEFDIIYGLGISREGNLIDMGAELGIIKKAGAFFSYQDVRLGQGKENARDYLKQNPDLAGEIEKAIRASAGGTFNPVASPD
jgi:recombination protein RecA